MCHGAVMPLMLRQSYCITTEMLKYLKIEIVSISSVKNIMKMAILNYSLISLSRHEEKVQTVINLSQASTFMTSFCPNIVS